MVWSYSSTHSITSVLICNINSNVFVGGKFCIRILGFITSARDTLLKEI